MLTSVNERSLPPPPLLLPLLLVRLSLVTFARALRVCARESRAQRARSERSNVCYLPQIKIFDRRLLS